MKKTVKYFAAVLCAAAVITGGVLFSGMSSKAEGIQAQMNADDTAVTKDATIEVTLDVSSDTALNSIEGRITYDADLLTYVPDDDTSVVGADGTLSLAETFEDGQTSASYHMTFTASATGEAAVLAQDMMVETLDTMELFQLKDVSVSISISEDESVATDSRLSDIVLGNGTFKEEFDPDVFIYHVTVPTSEEQLIYSSVPMSENSIITAEGLKTLGDGENIITLTVQAPSGDISEYTLYVTKSDTADETSSADETETAETVQNSETTESEAVDGVAETEAPDTQASSSETESSAEE